MVVPLGACSLYPETIKVFSGAVADIPTPSFVQNPTSTPINLNLASIAPTNPGTNSSSCMTDSGFDACIFYKNPVAQQGKIFSPVLSSTTDLTSIQTYGVKIDATGQTLDNNNLSICADMNGSYKRFKNLTSTWKTSYLNSRTNFELEQVMAYYWLNQQINTMKQWTGNFYASNKKIQVFAYNPILQGSVLDNAFWDGSLNVIVMGRSTGMPAVSYGLAAEIYAHEMGHANLDYAAPDAIVDSDSCADKNGCIGAIHEGQADYHAALMFGPGPIGESITNNMGGLSASTCVIGRTISTNSSLTADKVYNPGNCSYTMGTTDTSDDIPARGEIHDMGALYASIWWEVRKNAAAAGKPTREVDQLFMEHLAVLQSADTFVSSLCKIVDIDKNNFSSRYSQLFSAEYKKRGLPGLESCP